MTIEQQKRRDSTLVDAIRRKLDIYATRQHDSDADRLFALAELKRVKEQLAEKEGQLADANARIVALCGLALEYGATLETIAGVQDQAINRPPQ